MKPHPVVEEMMNAEVERRVAELMDLIREHGRERYTDGYADGKWDTDYGDPDEGLTEIENRIKLLVMGAMVAEMEGATR